MPLVDMPLEQLRSYRPRLTPPPDLLTAWSTTLAEARTHPLDLMMEPITTPLRTVDAFDVTFAGFGGDPIKAWLLRPSGATGPLPVVVEYNGYGGGRGLPHERLLWASAGYAHLFMDTRGQGSAWGSGGHTADASGASAEGGAPAHPGFMTRGALSFSSLYFRRLVTDAVRAVEAARGVDWVDPGQVVVAGQSQGGGLALAAAGLADDVAATLADVPFLCDIRRGVEVSDSDPYGEVARYLSVHRDHVDAVFRSLSYVDGVHLGALATAPALFSVALQDRVCPPSTVFAAVHAYGGPVDLEIYPFNGHEGGQGHHDVRKVEWLARTLAARRDGA